MSKSVTALNDADARIYKMVVIGDGAVGKSALTIQVSFSETLITITKYLLRIPSLT